MALYDLNIAWSPATPTDRLLQTLTTAHSLGYTTVALNHTLELPFPANPTAPFPSLPSTSSSSTSTSSASSSTTPTKLPHILHRATLPLADPSASNYRLPSLASAYDILAIRPLTEKAFQNACLTLDIPLISLDMSQHFPFYFRPKPCMAAVSRGVRFELCYAQALGPAGDARARANFISNATSLVRATRGRGIVISSEAKSAFGLRAPADVVNLFNVWGLQSEKAMEGLRTIPRGVVVNEGLKRDGFRGVVNIVRVVKRKPAAEGEQTDDQSSAAEQGGKRKNQKRKNGGEDAQPVSKRGAKKMKLAARAAAAEKKAS